MVKARGIQFLVAGFCLAICCAGQGFSEELWYSETRDLYYGLPVHVQYVPANPELSRRVWAYLERINGVFNDDQPESEISGLNRQRRINDVALSPMLAGAFGKARQVWQWSEGVFDVTCAPIRNLWKQAAVQSAQPSDTGVAAVRDRCGMSRVVLGENLLTCIRDRMEFDFGGIVKGIIADHVIAMLREGGAQSALIQIGCETAAFGPSPKQSPFRIAVQHPTQRNGAWCEIQDPGDGLSASTIGNYENPILVDGEEFYHIMDPRTGYPAKTQVVSVSIVFPQTGKNWIADSFSTAGVLLGPEKTFEIVQRMGGEAMFLIRERGEIREVQSGGWERFE